MSLLPTPSYKQYFATTIPFLIVAVVPFLESGLQVLVSPDWLRHITAVTAVVVGVFFLTFAALAMDDIFNSPFEQTSIDAQHVSAAIDARTPPGETILSFWPGFAFESHVRQLPGLESDFAAAAMANSRFTDRHTHDYRVATFADLNRTIEQKKVRLIVIGGSPTAFAPWERLAADSGYRKVAVVRGRPIYLRDGD